MPENGGTGTRSQRYRHGCLYPAMPQAIKKWYAEMPDKLGAYLAKRRPGEVAVKAVEERESLERLREKEFLQREGNYTNEVRHICWVGNHGIM